MVTNQHGCPVQLLPKWLLKICSGLCQYIFPIHDTCVKTSVNVCISCEYIRGNHTESVTSIGLRVGKRKEQEGKGVPRYNILFQIGHFGAFLSY